ncbi:hypothetical protein RhoFasB10_03717 [Rhodococcus sp. B10]|nr:hypothetical protein [Rhodococcus sp. B10]
MPWSGMPTSCSLIDLIASPAELPATNASATSMPARSSRTGKMVVNHPIVRPRSAPGTTPSSRPWPSRLTRASSTSAPRSRRHAVNANARPVSSPSLTLPWNASGSVVSRCSVTSTGSDAFTRSTVASTSTAGSSARVPMSGSSPVRIRVHSGSSDTRRSATSARPVAQRRIDVPVSARSGFSPATIRAHAVARSGTRIRQETPSITRW